MRRPSPHLAAVLTVLLLMQWADAASACLASLRFDPATTLCHADSETPNDHPKNAGPACPHCAPLPPALAASPPVLAPPRTPPLFLATPLPTPTPTPATPRPAAHQPRAPPTPA